MIGGADEDRTRDLLTASQALSQLSYSPTLSKISKMTRSHDIAARSGRCPNVRVNKDRRSPLAFQVEIGGL